MCTFFIMLDSVTSCAEAKDESADIDFPVEERANIGIAELFVLMTLTPLLLLCPTPYGLPGADTL